MSDVLKGDQAAAELDLLRSDELAETGRLLGLLSRYGGYASLRHGGEIELVESKSAALPDAAVLDYKSLEPASEWSEDVALRKRYTFHKVPGTAGTQITGITLQIFERTRQAELEGALSELDEAHWSGTLESPLGGSFSDPKLAQAHYNEKKRTLEYELTQLSAQPFEFPVTSDVTSVKAQILLARGLNRLLEEALEGTPGTL